MQFIMAVHSLLYFLQDISGNEQINDHEILILSGSVLPTLFTFCRLIVQCIIRASNCDVSMCDKKGRMEVISYSLDSNLIDSNVMSCTNFFSAKLLSEPMLAWG